MSRIAAAVVTVLIAATTWIACGGATEEASRAAAAPSADAAKPASDTPAPAPPPAGAGLYKNWGCAMCHGAEQQGNRFGPPLRALEPHWTAEDLAGYLADPPAFHDRDDRMREIVKTYEAMVMPAFDQYPESERLELARWLLTLKKK